MKTEVKRQKRAIATRELILDCAEIEFFKSSASRTTLDEIAAASGVTRGAIYGHFANKYEVLGAIFERSELPLDPFTISEFDSENSQLETLQQVLLLCLRDVLLDGRKRRLYGILHSLLASKSAGFVSHHTLHSAGEVARLRIRRVLERATDAGEIYLIDSSELVAAYIHACLTGYFLLSLSGMPLGDPDDLASRIVTCALSSIRTDWHSASADR